MVPATDKIFIRVQSLWQFTYANITLLSLLIKSFEEEKYGSCILAEKGSPLDKFF
jgi:hypothetical protein